MKKVIVFLFSFWVFIVSGQDNDIGKRTSIVFITSEVIAEENFSRDAFITWIKAVQQSMGELMKSEKGDNVVKIIARWAKDRKCSYDISTCPANDKLVETAGSALKKVESPVANFTSFEIMLSFRFNEGCSAPDVFNPVISTAGEQMIKELSTQSLQQRKETIRHWALNEAIPVLSHFTRSVDAQFAGVRETGGILQRKSFLNGRVNDVTDNNALYWRGVMEMGKGNMIIPISKVFMHVANDEFDLARRYLGMLFRFADKESLASHYLLDLNKYLDLFYKCHDSLMREGITLHDNMKYDQAIQKYNSILAAYPNSAWARYELYFSTSYKNNPGKSADKTSELWNKHKDAVYGADPLYPMGGAANNAKDGFILFRHIAVKDLFADSKKLKEDLITYADIALDLGSYAFAGHLYWYLLTLFPEEKFRGHNFLVYYLYSLEKLGVTGPRAFFKDDFSKEISSLDKERDEAMKKDPLYKSFKEE